MHGIICLMSMRTTVRQLTIPLLLTVFTSLFVLNWLSPVYSNTAEELEGEINKKQEELNKNKTTLSEIEKRIKEISSSTAPLTEKINLLNAEITKLQNDIDTKNKEIEEKQKLLETKKEHFDMVSTELYMETRQNSAQLLFSFSSLEDLLQNLFVKKSAISILREDIEKLGGEFTSLSQIKEDLDKQKKDLDDSYALVQAEKDKLQKELSAQLASKTSVTRKINGLSAELSDLQYQLIIVRQGGTYVNPDSVPASGDVKSTLQGFNAQAPAGSFGVFSIGAYTHRNGMSQWGARARANAGQNYQQILSAYYPGKALRTGTVVVGGAEQAIMTNIKTTSYGVLNFEEDYLLRLNEVPENWPMEVLKAQAIAARTYAINYTGNDPNKAICTTESCQVAGDGKKSGAWKTAVEATRGVIMSDGGGSAFSAQYAAVHGGWGNQVGWDTTDGTGNGDWMSRAYDAMSGVSWFYKIWYRQNYSETSSTCGRNPWLSQAEMSDIVNAYQVWTAKNRNDSRIIPVYDACHSSGSPYSHAELRSLAAKPVTSISSVAVANGGGSTSTVIFNTNAGVISMSGNDFKTVYNLRAPGHLRIPQSSFVHINIHKK